MSDTKKMRLLPVKIGTISPEDRAVMAECGVAVVEHPAPAELVFLPVELGCAGQLLLDAYIEAERVTPLENRAGLLVQEQRRIVIQAILRIYGQEDAADKIKGKKR